MLTIGGTAAAVGNHRQSCRFGNVADFDERRQSAAPNNVGLKYVDQTLFRSVEKRVDTIPVLTSSQRLPRNALTEMPVLVERVWQESVFQPLEVVRTETFCSSNGRLDIQSHPEIEHQLCFCPY